MGATNNFIGANFILGMANLANPDYEIQRWHTATLSYAIAVMAAIANLYGPHLFDKLSRGMIIWNITAFFIVIITILATNDHKQSASFVFHDFQNFTGWSTGFTAILGLLQSAFGMCKSNLLRTRNPECCANRI
jgi:choline transport protein